MGMIINPYAGVDWTTCVRIAGVSHAHCNDQEETWASQAYFEDLYAAGIRHMAISGYYPSQPTEPLKDYFTVPADVISCPNAEHHNMSNVGGLIHCNSLGSTFSSGKPRGETPIGVNKPWQWTFAQIIRQLVYPDGGGITINHPMWTGLSLGIAEKMLDFAPEVLGIEIFNATSELENKGWALDMWDVLLKTGRRCWGFAVPDHAHKGNVHFQGRTCLLASAATDHACLKAYRDGAFYSQIGSTPLAFEHIRLNGRTLDVATTGADSISVIIDGQRKTFTGNTCQVQIPAGATYARVEASSADDAIFSNPVMFRIRHRRVSLIPALQS